MVANIERPPISKSLDPPLQKITINENVSFTDHASGIQLPHWSEFGKNWENDSVVAISQDDAIAKFVDIAVFVFSSLATGPSFVSISFLVLELW